MTPSKWILIVEDDADLASSLGRFLENDGYRVLISTKVPDALRMTANQRFGCILLDYNLGSGTGEQVISAVRKSELSLNYKTPIILMSGNLDNYLLAKTVKGISGALVKPFDRKSLSERVSSVLPPPTAADPKKTA